MNSQLSSVKNSHHDRKVASIKLAAYKNELNSGKTQREAARKLDIARSTLNGWKKCPIHRDLENDWRALKWLLRFHSGRPGCQGQKINLIKVFVNH